MRLRPLSDHRDPRVLFDFVVMCVYGFFVAVKWVWIAFMVVCAVIGFAALALHS